MRRFDPTPLPLAAEPVRSARPSLVNTIALPQITFLQRRIQDMVEEALADVGEQTLIACAVAWHRQGVPLADLVRETGVPLDVLTAAVATSRPTRIAAKPLTPTQVALVTPPFAVPRKRGRPLGSRNKPKLVPVVAVTPVAVVPAAKAKPASKAAPKARKHKARKPPVNHKLPAGDAALPPPQSGRPFGRLNAGPTGRVAKALAKIKRGASVRAAARAVGISPQAVSQARQRWLGQLQ